MFPTLAKSHPVEVTIPMWVSGSSERKLSSGSASKLRHMNRMKEAYGSAGPFLGL